MDEYAYSCSRTVLPHLWIGNVCSEQLLYKAACRSCGSLVCSDYSPEPAHSCCGYSKTSMQQKREKRASELLLKVCLLLLPIKSSAALVCGRTETRLPSYGWSRVFCNCFQHIPVCKLVCKRPKEGCDRSLTHNLLQPSNPRQTRLLSYFSSPVAIGLSAHEIQSLQLPL